MRVVLFLVSFVILLMSMVSSQAIIVQLDSSESQSTSTSSIPIVSLRNNTVVNVIDTNATTECAGTQVLLGNGSCYDTSNFAGSVLTDTNATTECSGFQVLLGNGSCFDATTFTTASATPTNLTGNGTFGQVAFFNSSGGLEGSSIYFNTTTFREATDHIFVVYNGTNVTTFLQAGGRQQWNLYAGADAKSIGYSTPGGNPAITIGRLVTDTEALNLVNAGGVGDREIWLYFDTKPVGLKLRQDTGEIRQDLDSVGFVQGDGQDASMLYNASDWVFNPKLVGSGFMYVLGDLFVNNTELVCTAENKKCAGAAGAGKAGDANFLTNNSITLYFNETKMNNTINQYITSTTYLPCEYAVEEGTPSGNNNIGNLSYYDDEVFNVTESAGGAPVLTVNITFCNVTDFDSIQARTQYLGGQGHEIWIQLWDFTNGAWESYSLPITDQATLTEIAPIGVTDDTNHINSSGGVVFRFWHEQTGISSHKLLIDYVNIVKNPIAITTIEHDSLGGRDSPENHPWALPTDGSRPMTGNLNMSSFNITQVSTLFVRNISGFSPIQILNDVVLNGGLNMTGNLASNNASFMGKVGIGTINPKKELDVRGDINATNLTVSGIAFYSSNTFYHSTVVQHTITSDEATAGFTTFAYTALGTIIDMHSTHVDTTAGVWSTSDYTGGYADNSVIYDSVGNTLTIIDQSGVWQTNDIAVIWIDFLTP